MRYSVAQRTREIGIRMLIGAGGALALSSLIASLLFGASTFDPIDVSCRRCAHPRAIG